MSKNFQTPRDPAGRRALQDEITKKKRVEAELREREAQLLDLSLRLLQAQENERARLAYELHGEIGQDLTILKLDLQAMLKTLSGADALLPGADERVQLLGKLSGAYELSEKLLEHVRNLSLDLRPTMLDNLGLAPTLRWYLGRVTESTNLEVQFHVPADFGRLPAEMETVFFRIAQEAVTNVLRHARARNLWVQLAQRGGVNELHITDDGLGFEFPKSEVEKPANETLGLRGMARRASLIGARLEIETAPGKGARVSLMASGVK